MPSNFKNNFFEHCHSLFFFFFFLFFQYSFYLNTLLFRFWPFHSTKIDLSKVVSSSSRQNRLHLPRPHVLRCVVHSCRTWILHSGSILCNSLNCSHVFYLLLSLPFYCSVFFSLWDIFQGFADFYAHSF